MAKNKTFLKAHIWGHIPTCGCNLNLIVKTILTILTPAGSVTSFGGTMGSVSIVCSGDCIRQAGSKAGYSRKTQPALWNRTGQDRTGYCSRALQYSSV